MVQDFWTIIITPALQSSYNRRQTEEINSDVQSDSDFRSTEVQRMTPNRRGGKHAR
jgi:hypothetical protein